MAAGGNGEAAKVEGGGKGDWPLPIKVDGGQRLLAAAADDKLWYRQGGQ